MGLEANANAASLDIRQIYYFDKNDKITGALFVGKIATIGTINGLVKKQITIKGHKEEVLEDKLALLIF